MASCDKELSTLPVLTTCPTGVEYVLLIGVPSLINGDNLGGYGLISWSDIINCLCITDFSLQYFINSADFPSGTSSYTIKDEDGNNIVCCGSKNTDIYVEIQNQPVSALAVFTEGDFTYSITYNPNSTIINFSQNGNPTPPGDNQVIVIRGKRQNN